MTTPSPPSTAPEVESVSRSEADDRATRRVLEVCDAAGRFIEYWGFKAILGRIWMLLALRSEPMSQSEVAEVFGVSRSLVSGAIAELTRRGLVTGVGDHRNAPYTAIFDVWPSIADVLRSREWMLIETARLALVAALDEVEYAERRGQKTNYDPQRMRSLLLMTESAQAFLRTLLAIRSSRPVESLAGWVSRASEIVQSLRGVR